VVEAPLPCRLVFDKLQEHKLFLRKSKCFRACSIAYLGYTIFLGLAGYCRHFIGDYGTIVAPLTKLSCKDGFHQSTSTDDAFRSLQCTLTSALVLQLPAFDKKFIIKCDAASSGFGAALHQGRGVVAFFSRQITPQHAKLEPYERKLIGLIQEVCHWSPYL
jgi:hypothetical protein